MKIENHKHVRQCFAIASILVSGIALGLPETMIFGTITITKLLVSISTALNAVNLYLLKEEI